MYGAVVVGHEEHVAWLKGGFHGLSGDHHDGEWRPAEQGDCPPADEYRREDIQERKQSEKGAPNSQRRQR